MSKKKIIIYISSFILLFSLFGFLANGTFAQSPSPDADLIVSESDLGFKIPSLGEILTFTIRAFFVIAGLAALFYMLLGAFAWVTSGGDSDAVSAAQGKIQAAVVGMLIIVGVLSIIWTLEQVIFDQKICLGISCELTIPTLLEAPSGIQVNGACQNNSECASGNCDPTFKVCR